jgi:hypothetical protein
MNPVRRYTVAAIRVHSRIHEVRDVLQLDRKYLYIRRDWMTTERDCLRKHGDKR